MIDADRDRLLREESARTGQSVGEIVRRAIDEALGATTAQRRLEAGRRLLAMADTGPGPEEDWEFQKERMLQEQADRYWKDPPESE